MSVKHSFTQKPVVSALDLLTDLPPDVMRCDTADRSFSPFYSNIGLGLGDTAGIQCIFTHYNRRTQYLGNPAITFDAGALKSVDAFSIRFSRGEVAFFGRDAFVVDASGEVDLPFLNDPAFTNVRTWSTANGITHTLLRLQNGDMRDPDSHVPVLVSVRRVHQSLTAIAFQLLVIDPDLTERVLLDAPTDARAARNRTRAFYDAALNGLKLAPENRKESQTLGAATYTLLSNTVAAPGLMEGHLASFPSRGGYPTHFLWDACFHVLALRDMDPRLARDALMIPAVTQRVDGLIGHFICSTWVRPAASQPPLLGWAADHLVAGMEEREACAFKRDILPTLVANNAWWFNNRPTPQGLIFCSDPFETGWDDTPRLDDGPIIPCDMNAYLLLQMQTAARFAKDIGHFNAADMAKQADAFAALIVEMLFDPDVNLFLDRDLETGEKRPILTPACFLPLLADLPLPQSIKEAMIRDHLLDAGRLAGKIPFPSVAYDDQSYNASQMWRGPMWPPIYWLLLEIMQKHGFAAEGAAMADRLYDVICADGNLHEYFNSADGSGLGFAQQGWTAAIALRLHLDRKALIP